MEILDKTKTFIKKHKRGLIYTTCICGGVFLGIKIRQDKYNFGAECFLAGSRLNEISYMKAMEKVLDSSKTEEVIAESTNVIKTIYNDFSKHPIKPEAFNRMYESLIIPKK